MYSNNWLSLFLQYLLATAIAKVYAAFARRHLDEAELHLKAADVLAHQLRRNHDVQALKILRAVLARQRGLTEVAALMSEAISLANLSGNVRLLIDTHPEAVRMAGELCPAAISERAAQAAQCVEPTSLSSISSPAPLPVRQGLLTAKERRCFICSTRACRTN